MSLLVPFFVAISLLETGFHYYKGCRKPQFTSLLASCQIMSASLLKLREFLSQICVVRQDLKVKSLPLHETRFLLKRTSQVKLRLLLNRTAFARTRQSASVMKEVQASVGC